MRRDDDLLREILFKLEDEDDYISIEFGASTDSSEYDRKVFGHLLLLADAGLVELSGKYRESARITNYGHDFIAAIRDDTHWNQTKRIAESAGAKTIGILFDVAIGLAKQRLARLLENGV